MPAPATEADRNTAARETILARVREALQTPASLPHLKTDLASEMLGQPVATDSQPADNGLPLLTVLPETAARPWLPDGGDTIDERLVILTENLEKLRAEVQRVADLPAAAAVVADLVRERGWQRVAWHQHPLVDSLVADGVTAAGCNGYAVDEPGFDKRQLEACDASITACEAVVSQTGSILVSSATGGGRGLSILPPVHIVVAPVEAVVSTVGDALHLVAQRYAGRLPSLLSFITGPSRTGDIERILVLGAHGPKELIVLLVG
jgi:L-lactate dehydrogenase complex protein LldG